MLQQFQLFQLFQLKRYFSIFSDPPPPFSKKVPFRLEQLEQEIPRCIPMGVVGRASDGTIERGGVKKEQRVPRRRPVTPMERTKTKYRLDCNNTVAGGEVDVRVPQDTKRRVQLYLKDFAGRWRSRRRI